MSRTTLTRVGRISVSCMAIMLLVGTAECSRKAGAKGSGGSPAFGTAGRVTPPSATGPGHVAYMLFDRKAYVVEARNGARPAEVSVLLNKVSKGEDESIHIARDGSCFALVTTRFGCESHACLAIVPSDISTGAQVEADGDAIHPKGHVAIASGGAFVVYVGSGPHERDLFVTRRRGANWTSPVLLTGASKSAYNEQPALSYDGRKILLDCGSVPYGGEGTGICEVHLDGSGFRQVLTPGSGWAQGAKTVRHPDYAPDGSIVFEAEREDGERIWRLPAGASRPIRLGDYNNDNSPCVLPNGKVASLWLNRPISDGSHEIKVMEADGSSYSMALTGIDVVDSQVSCGN
jgi:hypothetical protein